MTNPKVIELRAHTELLDAKSDTNRTEKTPSKLPKKWPERALILDCETTTDQAQALLFGTYFYCRAKGGQYRRVVEQIFYADELDRSSVEILQAYSRANMLPPPLTRKQFIKRVLLRAIRAEALIVGFNLPFDLSRIVADACWTKRNGGGWSFTLDKFTDKDTGELREDQYMPRLIVKPKDGKGAFFRLTKVAPVSKKRPRAARQYPTIRCLDLKTLVWALDNESHSLDSACAKKGIPGKLPHVPSGLVSNEEIAYNRQDVAATLGLLNTLRTEFDRHPLNLIPDKAYSPASIAKAYQTEMGIIPPLQKFAIEPEILGIAMQAYYGGRAECRIRHSAVPVVHTDIRSEYPTVNALMGLSHFLTAEELQFEEATPAIVGLLASSTLDEVFDPDFWEKLAFFALVQPAGEILPVRTKYNKDHSNIGVNPLSSETPIWYAGPDIVAAKLLGGQTPKILRAIRVVARGQQPGLGPVRLRGMVEVDPRTDDFFKAVIEARARVMEDRNMSEPERESLQYFLKILANSGSYGLFVELNPERAGSDPKTGAPARAKLRVFSGERQFETTSTVVERPGDWYCPVFASLITAGGRLILAMIERAVQDAGGTYLLCDTDSMAIVASETGGPYQLQNDSGRVHALSWEEVREIVTRFERLNPYEFGPRSILKIESVNYSKGVQRQLFGYAIAAKRYAFFAYTPNREMVIEKASAHGLGFLYPPKRNETGSQSWIEEAWNWILRKALALPTCEPHWFGLPAMMSFTISTPEVLKVLQLREKGLSYRKRTKPANFILSPVIDPIDGYPVGVDPSKFLLIAPFTSNPSLWHGLVWTNLYNGATYQLAKRDNRLPFQAEARTYGDVVSEYRGHPEAKSLAPDGSRCVARTAGVLLHTPVLAAHDFATIGKETNRKWESEDNISLLETERIQYRPTETERLTTDFNLQCRLQGYATRTVSTLANVSRETVKAARRGRRIQKASAERLWRAVDALN